MSRSRADECSVSLQSATVGKGGDGRAGRFGGRETLIRRVLDPEILEQWFSRVTTGQGGASNHSELADDALREVFRAIRELRGFFHLGIPRVGNAAFFERFGLENDFVLGTLGGHIP